MNSEATSQIAVDLVLLPDDETGAVAREANARYRDAGEETEIDLQRAWPHLSLVMGLVDRSDLGALAKVLEELAPFVPQDLPSEGLKLFRRRGTRGTLWIGYLPTSELCALQDAALEALKPFLRGKTKPQHFHPATAPALDSDAQFATEYTRIATGKNFAPHITLGRTEMAQAPDTSDLAPPTLMRPAALALAWLGPGCTCPEILLRRDLA